MSQSVVFKILTCFLIFTGSIFPVSAKTLSQETFKTHLRWSLKAKKSSVIIDKKSNTLKIKTLDGALFSSMAEEISKLDLNKEYFNNVEYTAGKNGTPSEITIDLKNQSVELFTFFKDKEDKHVLDFWINQDLIQTKTAAVQKTPVKKKLKVQKPTPKPVAKKNASPKLDKAIDTLDIAKVEANKNSTEYRDFRYGSAFVMDVPAFIPPLESDINLAVKGPDFFYEIKDRPFQEGDKKETHMQLSINFYKKQKWGLMTKSIDLYEKRYGKDGNTDVNEFMKAVSLIKNSIKPKVETNIPKPQVVENEKGELIQLGPEINVSDRGIVSAAISILENIVDRTENYELKKACMRYMLESNIRENEYISALQVAKQLYVAATEQFDDEMIVRSSRVILYSLANLKQLDKMEEFLQNKAVMRVLPAQEGDAYISFVNLTNGDVDQVIARFKANEKGYTKPIHPAILFNTAEARFRKADYSDAIKLFDAFAASYSYFDVAGRANLRVALGYDLLAKDPKKVLKLYENAINKSSDAKARYEAKIRYVGLRVARKINPDEQDVETISFLEATPVEKKAADLEMKKLLWLTRLRSMISKGDYEAALAYLSSIPLETLRLVEKRAFNGDGAEIILGIVKKAYLDENYARAIKVWEVFKNKYEDKVAKNPYLRFIVTDSYLKLGLDKSFDESIVALEEMKKAPKRVFPRWVSAHKKIDITDYVNELKLLKLVQREQWKQADSLLGGLKGQGNINYNYYKGLVSYNLKKYNDSVKFFEELLVKPNAKNILSPLQSLKMLTAYAESLYQGNDQKRFRTNAAALVNDLRRSKGKKRVEAIERLEYLYIESLNGESKVNHELVTMKSKEFLDEHKGSAYTDRVKFLRGAALIKVAKADEGKALLEELINGEGTPEYIRGLARSELSSLMLKNKSL